MRLERLETRLTPSSAATAEIIGNDLVITGRVEDGSPVRDLVAVNAANLSAVTVRIDSGTSSPAFPVPSTHLTFTFALAPDSLIRCSLLDGNDTFQEAGALRCVVHGNDGSDVMSGGTGDDVLIGDAGLDNLRGNAGNDLILGGDGSDTLYGGDGDDVVVGGRSSLTDDDLLAVATAWAATHTVDEAFVATVTDGTGSDGLYGNLGADWSVGDAIDYVAGYSPGDGDVITRV